jgi:hypothetical protein
MLAVGATYLGPARSARAHATDTLTAAIGLITGPRRNLRANLGTVHSKMGNAPDDRRDAST